MGSARSADSCRSNQIDLDSGLLNPSYLGTEVHLELFPLSLKATSLQFLEAHKILRPSDRQEIRCSTVTLLIPSIFSYCRSM